MNGGKKWKPAGIKSDPETGENCDGTKEATEKAKNARNPACNKFVTSKKTPGNSRKNGAIFGKNPWQNA